MAQEYDNKNTWVLFKNDKGTPPNEKRPDYTGTEVDADGVEHRIAGWIRESKTGTKFISGTRQLKEDAPQQAAPVQDIAEMESDVPF